VELYHFGHRIGWTGSAAWETGSVLSSAGSWRSSSRFTNGRSFNSKIGMRQVFRVGLAVFSGCDFTPGVIGVGRKNAIEYYVKEGDSAIQYPNHPFVMESMTP